MKRIVASNNIYYIFKPAFKNDKRRYYEDIFVPKFFLNLYHLSKKKKILKVENKKYEDKDYLLNINSYFKQEQINNINTYNTNTGNKSVTNKNFKIKNRFFSANAKNLPKIRYTVNDILHGNFKSTKKVASLKLMADEAYIIICSKINRIHLIIRFIKEQIDKFYKLQQNIYQEFENSCNEIIKLSERIKEMVKKQSQTENINFIDDWIKTNPNYKKEYLVPDVIINNLRELLSSIKLDINYSYDERFILWSIKNGFFNYLKN